METVSMQRCFSIAVLACALALPAIAEPLHNAPPAFPGAEGFGAKATGGRGGEVYHVTNLDDSGKGSFRDAVSGPKRIVVFDVGGEIVLKSPISLASDLTILGQTAPGDGVEISKYEVSFSGAHNICVRYVRFRQGLTKGQEKKYTIGLNQTADVIVDHCSIEWGRWDCIGLTDSKDITLQYCIIGEGIDPQRFGCLCQSDNVTFSHNLWIHNQSRNPKAKGKVQYINNVVYNWGVTGYVGGHSAADHWADLVGNYFIKGPSSSDRFAGEFTATDHIYQSGNVVDLDRDGTLSGRPVTAADLSGAGATIASAPYFPDSPTSATDTAEEAYHKVIAGAGCSLHRDTVDTRLIEEVKSLGKLGTITHDPATLGTIPPLRGGAKPNYPSDAGAISAKTGYANIEDYADSLINGEAK